MDTKRSGIPSGSTSEWCVWGIQESEDRVRLVNLRLGQSRFIPVEQAAAAPELLEALREIHNIAATPCLPENVSEDWPTVLMRRLGEIRHVSQKAVARAEGR